jgi:hypothetical protein
MGCSFLKCHPNLKAYPFQFATQLPVPDPLNFYAVGAQKIIAFRIVLLAVRMTVHETISFQDELRFGAIEIQSVNSEGMLPSEFVTGETTITEYSPKLFLGPGCFLSQSSGPLAHGSDG